MLTKLAPNETAADVVGPAGKLEVAVGTPTGIERNALGIICHPHPLHGGTMYNKVVTTLARTLQGVGLTTVRFNFRGVGKSQGEYDFGRGEVEDLLAVVKWLQKEMGHQEIWLAGFSFGAFIAASGATQLSVKKLITVAPPVSNFPMRDLPPILCDWILVQGEKDDVVIPEEVFAFAESRQPPPIVIKLPEADHFFHGQLGELKTKLEEVLKNSSPAR
jgi:alpha/beta superfamily hydrolase